MEKLTNITQRLDHDFQIEKVGKDPGFSRFIPAVYDPIGFRWAEEFEKQFTQLFNGLMMKGASIVNKVFLAVFPTDDVLETFIKESESGDLLFMHHPLLMECGDPRGKSGRGFVPIKQKYINAICEKQLSIYTCHIPLDIHPFLSTNIAIAESIHARNLEHINGNEYILYGEINQTDTNTLISELLEIFHIPYVDFEGKNLQAIEKVAIVAGCGDVVDWMREAEANGVQAYITGEVHCHIDNEYGKYKYNQVMDYVKTSPMSLIGVSHSASEFLVHKTLMKQWFENHFEVETILIPQNKWWI